MKKTLTALVLLAGLAGTAMADNGKKPDLVFFSLAAANVVAGTIDMALGLSNYRAGRIDEANPAAKYIFDNCPWAAPFYMIATTGALILGSYILDGIGLRPLGSMVLIGALVGRGYVIYLTIKIAG